MRRTAASSSSPRRCSPRGSRRPREGGGDTGSTDMTPPYRTTGAPVLDRCPSVVLWPHLVPRRDPLDPLDPTLPRRRFLQAGVTSALLCTIGGEKVVLAR